jgi:hypothetical protein
MEEKVRGSEKLLAQLFGESLSEKQIRSAVDEARASGLRIVRWWWYGQPAIDQIVATLQVDRPSLGPTVERLAGMHSGAMQVNLDVFPFGIPAPDFFHVNVAVKRNLQRLSG